MKLYGKERLKQRLDNIAARGRLPHAVMLSGGSGSGRKTLAKYIAELFLCDNGNGSVPPCGECTACRNIENDGHADVIFVKRACVNLESKDKKDKNDKDKKEKKEKKLGYTIGALREVLGEVLYMPTGGDVKVYVFEDCDTMNAQMQNALLKLIEEPPPHLRFIFTCENTSAVLETVMSRVTEFEVPDTTEPECKRCLIDMGVQPDRAGELSGTFAGNIGKALEALNDGENSNEIKLIGIARKAAAAIGRRDGYGTAAALSEVSNRAEANRADFGAAVRYLSRILRDALALGAGCEAEFFCKAEAGAIASAYSENEIMNMLDAAFELEKNEQYNLNLPLSSVYFVSRIFG